MAPLPQLHHSERLWRKRSSDLAISGRGMSSSYRESRAETFYGGIMCREVPGRQPEFIDNQKLLENFNISLLIYQCCVPNTQLSLPLFPTFSLLILLLFSFPPCLSPVVPLPPLFPRLFLSLHSFPGCSSPSTPSPVAALPQLLPRLSLSLNSFLQSPPLLQHRTYFVQYYYFLDNFLCSMIILPRNQKYPTMWSFKSIVPIISFPLTHLKRKREI